MFVCVYKDTTGLYTEEECNKDNTVDIDFPEDLVRDFFTKFILRDFKTEEDLSDRAFYEEWLEEFTADDTVDLCQYAEESGINIRDLERNEYIK